MKIATPEEVVKARKVFVREWADNLLNFFNSKLEKGIPSFPPGIYHLHPMPNVPYFSIDEATEIFNYIAQQFKDHGWECKRVGQTFEIELTPSSSS